MGNWNTGGGGGSAGDFDDSFNEEMGYTGGDFDEGDAGSTSVFGGGGGGSAGDFDEDFNYADYQDSQMDALDKISAQFDMLDNIQDKKFNFNKDYAVMDASGDIRGFDPRGGRYGADDAAFFSRAIGEYGIAGDIYSTVDRSTGFGATVRRGFEGLANGIAERFGTSMTRDYTVIPDQGYVGEVFEDYSVTDAIGNVIGMVAPGGARVDRYMSRELTGTGKGAMAFGEAKAFYGAIDTQYAMTPAEEEAMFAEQRAADEAERARGGGDASVATVPERVTGTVVRPRSALLGSLLGDTARSEYNIVAPYATDAFSYFTGGMRDYFGFAEGGEVPGAQMGGEQEAITGPVGFVGGPPEQMTDAETVADDVPVEVQEGAYVLNAAAVEYMGSADVKKMILNAMQELKAQGVDKAQDVDKIELDTQVSLLVSKGEVLIPPQVAEVIGYDRLEKINKRGLRETQKRVEENGQSPEAEALDQQPKNPSEGTAMDDGGVAVRGSGSTGPDQKNVNLEAEVQGEGFIAKPRVNYSEQKNTTEFPDGVVVNEKGKNIGFAFDGQMFLSDDKSLRAGFERQGSSFKGSAKLPEQYGGDTIEFGSGSKMKRYNMGATFGPVDIDVSKTQVPQGEDVLGGSVRYRFSKDGDVTLEATDDGRSGRIGLNYRFANGGKVPKNTDFNPNLSDREIEQFSGLLKKFRDDSARIYDDPNEENSLFTGDSLLKFSAYLNEIAPKIAKGSEKEFYNEMMSNALMNSDRSAREQFDYFNKSEYSNYDDRDISPRPYTKYTEKNPDKYKVSNPTGFLMS